MRLRKILDAVEPALNLPGVRNALGHRRVPQNSSGSVRLPRVAKKSRGFLSDGQIARLALTCGQRPLK